MSTSCIATVDEAARRQYELAWLTGRPESIERFLPPPDDPLYQATLEELVLIEIEMSWKTWKAGQVLNGANQNGQLPDLVETYLQRFPDLRQDSVIHRLVEEECRARRANGNAPRVEEYQSRFPKLTLRDTLFADATYAGGGPIVPAVSSLQPGASLGRYRLASEYGRGSFGVVWKAEDVALGRSVALKQLKEYLAVRPEYRSRFLAEAKIAAQLQHPGIVPVHDVGGEESCPYYTMNLVKGQTLAEAIERFYRNIDQSEADHAVEWQRLLTAYLTVVRTMAFAHARGVLHRDLKPANILLGQYGETLILDWGLAKVMAAEERRQDPPSKQPIAPLSAEETQSGTVIGTPAYMSPEQASGRIEDLDERSDVYSLGAILYEVLTGQHPFQGDSIEVIRKVIHGERPPRPTQLRPNVSRPLEAICLKAMAHQPSIRYASAELLRADLEFFLADEPVAAYPEPWWSRAGRWIRRHKTIAASAAVAFVLLLIGSTIGYFMWSAAEAKRLQEAHERLTLLQVSTRSDEDAAAVELRAGRYTGAVRLLDRALASLNNVEELAEVRTRLEARRARLRRIAEFTRLADVAEEHVAMDRDDAGMNAAETALRTIHVFDHLHDWWKHLPSEDLDAEQLRQVREDASRLLLLLGLVRAKLGILAPLKLDFKGDRYYRAALELLPAVQNYHQAFWGGPAHAGLILENFCYYRLGQKDKIRVPKLPMTPRGPADTFFTGICHFWLGNPSVTLQIETVLPRQVARDIWQLGGIDRVTTMDTAVILLRMSSTLEPHRYWTHIWLGWCQFLSNRYESAGQAFESAVILRPNDTFAYHERATVLMDSAHRLRYATTHQQFLTAMTPAAFNSSLGGAMAMAGPVTTAGRCEAIFKQQQHYGYLRALQGIRMGIKIAPHFAVFHLQESQCLTALQRHAESMHAFAKGVELSPPETAWDGTSMIDTSAPRLLQGLIGTRAATPVNESDAWGVMAEAYWKTNQHTYAGQAAALAFHHNPTQFQAVTIRGCLALKAKKLDEARRDFEQVLAKHPKDHLTLVSLSRVRELSNEWDLALKGYETARQNAVTPWQRVEAAIGQARVLVQLGRRGEAKTALDAVTDLAPQSVASALRKLPDLSVDPTISR